MKCHLCDNIAEFKGDYLVLQGSRQKTILVCKDHKIFLRVDSVENVSSYLEQELWREADKL